MLHLEQNSLENKWLIPLAGIKEVNPKRAIIWSKNWEGQKEEKRKKGRERECEREIEREALILMALAMALTAVQHHS